MRNREEAWIRKLATHPDAQAVSKKNLNDMLQVLHGNDLCKQDPSQNVDVYSKALGKKLREAERVQNMAQQGSRERLMMKTLVSHAQTQMYQIAHWKVQVHGEQEKIEGPYSYPEVLSYTKEALLGLSSDELKAMTLPPIEMTNPILQDSLKEEMEMIAPIRTKFLLAIVKSAPSNLDDLEKSLQYIKGWVTPFTKRISPKIADCISKGKGRDVAAELTRQSVPKIFDPIEIEVTRRSLPCNLALLQLLAFKQYIDLIG